MTNKPNEPSAAAGDATPAAPRPAGAPVRSPFDSPTEQFAASSGAQATETIAPPADPLGQAAEQTGQATEQTGQATEQLGQVGGLATEKIAPQKVGHGTERNLPRTDEELGLDLDVPLYSQVNNAIPGAADSSTAEPSPTYSFASIPAAPAAPPENNGRRRRDDRRGTLDLGLLLLRLVIGGTFIYHGLQKAFGWFHGPGFDGIKTSMEGGGWKHVDLAAPMLIAGELGGGVLVVIGLATPLAAGALLAVILDAWMWKQGMVPGFQYSAKTNSVEIDSILVGLTTALILTGPGRYSIDRNRAWSTRPFLGSLAAFVAAVATAILVYIYLHGGNPLTGVGPFK
ncbi:DoxX family protein [Nocardia sp. NPDC005746]|uniref:DoxX family protein n=1 Tax=Nocardia sp. NPDC005746 TaxID=3157062 RepID=UPI0033D5288B